MRIVFHFSDGAFIERLFLGKTIPHRIEIVMDGGALFGPRPRGGVQARPFMTGGSTIRMAAQCGESQFDRFMHYAIEQTGKPYDWSWLPAFQAGGLPFRDWRSPFSWSGAEMVQWLSEAAGFPLVAEPKRVVTVEEIMHSDRLEVVGRSATSSRWERWKVWA